jgi:hypothetical protein
MDTKLITYTTEKLNKSEKSTLSKRLYGYLDKSNNSQYTYQRKGLLDQIKHIKICNNTFIIDKKKYEQIKKELRKRKATIKEWNIALNDF